MKNAAAITSALFIISGATVADAFISPSSRSFSSEVVQSSSSQKGAFIYQPQRPSSTLSVGSAADDINPQDVIPLGEDRVFTPEGYGFSASMGRVLSASDRDSGYYKAISSDTVTDVMENISKGKADVALVFDDLDDSSSISKLLGIFTESDYIKVRGGKGIVLCVKIL